MSRGVSGLWLVLLSCLLCGAAQSQPAPETAIKATFLLRFADFVEWPRAPSGPLIVCLSDAHPFGDAVATLATQTQVRGRRVSVRRLSAADDPPCAIAYVAPVDHAQLSALAKRPILTVGDASDFCDKGGIINFRTQRGRVRFEIDLHNAKRAGLALDTQLLQLATTVHGGTR